MVGKERMRMMFRLASTLTLVLALVGCGFGGDAERRPEAPPSLTTMLEDVIRNCGDDGPGAAACKRAMNTPSWIVGTNLKVPSGFISLRSAEIPHVYVRVMFVDGTDTDIVKIENPNRKGR